MKENLLLLHGALGSKNQFEFIKEKLDEYYDVHLMNFEGHGGSTTLNEFSIELFTENVLEYMDANSINKVRIFGYSMGGYVALSAALKIPKKISKL